MKNKDCLFSDIQNLCNAVSDWLIQKINNPMKPTRQYPVPVVTSYVITAEPVNLNIKLQNVGCTLNVKHQNTRFHSDCKLQNVACTLILFFTSETRVHPEC